MSSSPSSDWTHILAFDLDQWLAFLRAGNIAAALPAASRWFTEVRVEMERRGLNDVPEELRWAAKERAALEEAAKNGKINLNGRYGDLWRAFLRMEAS